MCVCVCGGGGGVDVSKFVCVSKLNLQSFLFDAQGQFSALHQASDAMVLAATSFSEFFFIFFLIQIDKIELRHSRQI